jgi:hypothetical protein
MHRKQNLAICNIDLNISVRLIIQLINYYVGQKTLQVPFRWILITEGSSGNSPWTYKYPCLLLATYFLRAEKYVHVRRL